MIPARATYEQYEDLRKIYRSIVGQVKKENAAHIASSGGKKPLWSSDEMIAECQRRYYACPEFQKMTSATPKAYSSDQKSPQK